jgi:membrane fusion protein (multidrug efflux system)
MRSLEQRESWLPWLLPSLILCLAWGVWMHSARVGVYAAAAQARIEVAHRANRIAAQEGGRIVRLSCALGQVVEAGAVVGEIDSSVEVAQLERQQIELAGLSSRIAALKAQIDAEQVKRAARARVDAFATQQAGFGLRQARLIASHQEELTAIAQELHRQHLTARMEAVSADVELAGSQLRVDGASLEIERLQANHEYEDKAELASIAELKRMLAELEAERLATDASVETARVQIERRKLRAPASGRLGSVAELQVGDVLKAGDVIATVIPADNVHVVADFVPDDAVGRIRPGDRARVLLRGFSYIEYGSLLARVTHVANEPHDGTIRVELALDPQTGPLHLVQHGLPAAVDIEVDRASPWALLLRTIGSSLTRAPVLPTKANNDIAESQL